MEDVQGLLFKREACSRGGHQKRGRFTAAAQLADEDQGHLQAPVRSLWQEGPADIIQRNPGVLVCTPAGMAKQSDEDILKAVELVEFLDANKGPIKALSTFLYLGFVAFIAYGVTAKGNPEYGLPLIGQCILGEPGSLYYGDCPPL